MDMNLMWLQEEAWRPDHLIIRCYSFFFLKKKNSSYDGQWSSTLAVWAEKRLILTSPGKMSTFLPQPIICRGEMKPASPGVRPSSVFTVFPLGPRNRLIWACLGYGCPKRLRRVPLSILERSCLSKLQNKLSNSSDHLQNIKHNISGMFSIAPASGNISSSISFR